jgi:hypothetical protein
VFALAAFLATAVLAAPADRTARYVAEMHVGGAQPVLIVGNGTVAADRRLATLRFVVRTGGKKKSGEAVLDARHAFVAYVRGPDSGAPAAKPWAAFGGAASVPFFDPGVGIRAAATVHGAGHARVTLTGAEARRLFPSAKGSAVADLWLDKQGRLQRLHATARSATKNLLITLDEAIASYGVAAAITVPPPSTVYAHIS